MMGIWTGLVRDTQCECGTIVRQNQLLADSCRIWVTKEHQAPCGKPCSHSPGSLVGDCHITGQCELCPTQLKPRKPPRARVSAEVTTSPILGPLTVNEVRIIAHMLNHVKTTDKRTNALKDVRLALQMPDATVRGTFRRLAARGIVRQLESHEWLLNIPASMSVEEMKL